MRTTITPTTSPTASPSTSSRSGTGLVRSARRRSPARLAALAVPLALTTLLGTTAASAHPRPALRHTPAASACRGQGTDPGALIRASADIVIDAPLSTVWKLQTDVERWPTWQKPVLTIKRLDPGPLHRGSRFRWTTPAPPTPSTPATTLTITSTIQQLRSGSCVLWSGPAVGEGVRIDEGVHLWTFREVGGVVRVHTEETWTGPQPEADVPGSTALLRTGLETWLRDLKATAEADGPCVGVRTATPVPPRAAG